MESIRLLLVDDSAEFLDAATRFLADKSRMQIMGTVLSGREAVEQTPLLKPDGVLMDLMMPEMDGLEATRLLKQLPTPPIVIVLSLHDDQSFRTGAREARADGYLTKRALAKQLLPLLEKLIPSVPECACAQLRPL
jgi:DNA-binding NarL/FixJ family response regulator